MGARCPLSQFATFDYTQSTPVLEADRIPTLTVQAVSSPAFRRRPSLTRSPRHRRLGQVASAILRYRRRRYCRRSKKSQASVIAVVPLMLLIMITVLMFQLKSFRRLVLALSVAPLGLIGVVGALLLSGRPLGFVAILGILALLGMITKNAVILIGQIDSEREQGKDVIQAAIDAAAPPPSHRPDRHFHGSWPDSDCANSVLGPNGRLDHGWTSGRDAAHADRLANGLRGHVRHQSKSRAHRGASMRPSKGFFWLWLLLTFVWIAISSSLAIESVATGTVISAAMAYVFARKFEIWRGIRFSPQRLYHFILYTGVFLVELVRANINMMRYVYAPRIDVDPGVVTVKTGLKSPIGRLALANSISLTPGSLVLDISEEELTRALSRHADYRRQRPQPDHCPPVSRSIWRKALADYILIAAAVLIFFGIGFGVVRLALGPWSSTASPPSTPLRSSPFRRWPSTRWWRRGSSIWTPRWSMAC